MLSVVLFSPVLIVADASAVELPLIQLKHSPTPLAGRGRIGLSLAFVDLPMTVGVS
jgi:hypothetical protein